MAITDVVLVVEQPSKTALAAREQVELALAVVACGFAIQVVFRTSAQAEFEEDRFPRSEYSPRSYAALAELGAPLPWLEADATKKPPFEHTRVASHVIDQAIRHADLVL